MSPSARVINVLIEKVLPWYRIEFVNVNSKQSHHVEVRIADVPMKFYVTKNDSIQAVLASEEPSTQDEHLVEHLNGILSGMTRNDAGELVDTKAS